MKLNQLNFSPQIASIKEAGFQSARLAAVISALLLAACGKSDAEKIAEMESEANQTGANSTQLNNELNQTNQAISLVPRNISDINYSFSAAEFDDPFVQATVDCARVVRFGGSCQVVEGREIDPALLLQTGSSTLKTTAE